MYFAKWVGAFKEAQRYKDMVMWLEDDDNALENGPIWDENLNSDSYTIANLQEWVDQKQVGILIAQSQKFT